MNVMQAKLRPQRIRGLALLEMSIVVLAVSLMVAALLPMVTAQYKRSTAVKNANATEAAKNALVGYAMMNGGLPPPYQFTGNTDGGRATIASPLVVSSAGAAGALPFDLLGTPVSGALAIPLLYDVHPMLRRDLPFTFSVNHYAGNDLTTAGTGASLQQLCRNLNTLAAIETSVREGTAPFASASAYAAVLPRVWRDGLTANFTAPASNSTGVAAVVVRRNPYALRQYDRENNVVAATFTSGYVKAATSLRIFENPATGENDGLIYSNSTAAYAGNTNAISHNELRDALVKAGKCGTGAAVCTNNQLFVTIQNNVQVTKGGVTQGAMLQWRQPATGSYNSLAFGQVVAQCMDVFNLNPVGTAQTLALRVALDEGFFGDTDKNLAGTGGWLTGTTVLSVPSTQAMVVRCGGTYLLSGAIPTFTLTPATLTGCTASN
jgi:type II secretory pathway pseudopilin PulG